MEDSRGQIVQSAAQVYDAFFVPALFGEWSPRLAEMVALRPGEKALDVACGTGVLAREMAERVGPDNVTGLDCNEGMLEVAKTRNPGIAWQKGQAEELPFANASFDVVACQFGLMFFADKVAAMRHMWRVLKPEGRLVVAVWGALDATPGYAAMVSLLRRLFGEEIANELRAPFALGERDVVAGLMAQAGLPNAEVTTVVGQAKFPSITDWVRTDVRGWTLADKITDEQYALLAREAEVELARFTTEDGTVAFATPAKLVTAKKPS